MRTPSSLIPALALAPFLALLLAPLPSRASDPPTTDEPSPRVVPSPFQARHGDLVKLSREKALERDAPLLRETPEPSITFDPGVYRQRHGNRTRDVGQAWQAPATSPRTTTRATTRAKGGVLGEGLAVDFAVESLDLRAASGIGGLLGTPPDTMGAVGPSQFFTVQNLAYRVHDKATGSALVALDVGANDFWLPAVDPTDRGGGDPRVRFDRQNDRWVVIAFDLGPLDGNDPTFANNRILIALSDGPELDAQTLWTQFFFVPKDTVGGGQQDGCLVDYPMLGLDRHALYIGANMFDFGSPSGACGGSSMVTDTAVYVLPLALLPAGGGDVSSITTALDGLLDSAPTWTPMPVENGDPAATVGYVVGADPGSDTQLKLGRISNPGGAPGTPTIAWSDVTISNKNNGFDLGVPYPGEPEPEGFDGSWGLDRLSLRPIGGALLRGGRLFLSMTSSVRGPTGERVLAPQWGDRHSVVFFEVDVTSNTLVQDGNIFDATTPLGGDPLHVWAGSIAVNGQGHGVIAGTGTNTTDLAPSAVWAGRLAADPLGAFGPPRVYLEGRDTGSVRQDFEVRERETRWGDYAQVTVDPCDDMTFYALAEYQDALPVSTGGNWATGLARILAPAPSFVGASATTIPSGRASTSVTVTGTGFYSPPATGMPACRTDIEASSDIPGLVVNGVTYNSPTEIVIDLDTTGANGSGTLTITNPDGQTTDFGAMVSPDIFLDGFETGNTSQWSSSSP